MNPPRLSPSTGAKRQHPREGIVPNPQARLEEQIHEVMRFLHYSARTETSYCDWIRRHMKFHGMRSPLDAV